MKTTLELPDSLIKQIKLRALNEGRKLKDAVADLLRKGLAASDERPATEPAIGKDPETGLPIILGTRPARPGEELTPERVAEILLQQEVSWRNDAPR